MATRDLIPETYDDESFDFESFDDLETIELPVVTTTFAEPRIEPVRILSLLPRDMEPEVVAPLDVPAPTVSTAFRDLMAIVREQLRGWRPQLDRRSVVKMAAQGVSVVGVMLLALALFEGAIGSLTERRDQRELRGAFEEILSSGGAFAPITNGGIIPPGTPVASIEIPAIGLNKIVAEGTRADDLRKGPGHLRSTPLPGQHGNAVIAGRRTTYGGPFLHLDQLNIGDVIHTTTPFGRFTYRVRDVQVLRAGAADLLGATMTDNLTLTTSAPVYRATKRLVVVARLDGKMSKYPDPLRQTQVGADEGSFFGDASKALPAVFWEILVLASLLLTRALYGRWRRWPTYLITTPLVLAAMFGWLECMVALLPSTL